LIPDAIPKPGRTRAARRRAAISCRRRRRLGGGLEALVQFLGGVPNNSGMAFVIVQHLDPSRHSMLPELLRRATPMVVREAADRMQIEPDCVYVIPPNKDLALLDGKLQLLEPAMPRGLRLPIDFFFRSLADEQRERAVGIILSGMGSDGTRGLQAIRERGGLALVQTPATAGFAAMPRSVVAAGLADAVASPGELAGLISGHRPHPAPAVPARPGTALRHSAFEKSAPCCMPGPAMIFPCTRKARSTGGSSAGSRFIGWAA